MSFPSQQPDLNSLFNLEKWGESLGSIVNFLKEKDLWEKLVELFSLIVSFFKKIFFFINSTKISKELVDFLLSVFKLIINLFIALFNILIDIFNWLLNLFK